MNYKKRIIYFFAISLLYSIVGNSQDLVQYVQSLSGTASSTTISALKHNEAGTEQNANTIPAVGLPFGMTQWVAQTRAKETKCLPPYYYKDNLLSGFRGTHWISGSCTQDYGSFTVMPVVGKLETTVDKYSVAFSHEDETATPYYYKLNIKNISTEMTSTLRCGIMRFTMLNDDSLYLLISPNSDYNEGSITVNASKGEVWGYNPAHRIYQGWGQPAGFNGWFYIKIQKKISKAGTFSGDEIFASDTISNRKDIGAYIGFKLKKGEQIQISIGTSFSSLEGAKKNLATEVGPKNFNDIKLKAKSIWENDLSKIKISGKDEKAKRIFYTAMYHAMQLPRLYNDVDGTYPAFTKSYQLEKLKAGNYYDDFSMWDIFRAQLPLFEILDPTMINDFVQSMMIKGQQGTWLPIFPCWNNYTSEMVGDHVTAFIASAYAKGIRNYDINEAYDLMRKNAFTIPDQASYVDGKGRRALPSYLKYGYIPMEDSVPIAFHKKEQVSRTLEYAYDDYALSVIAKSLNKTEDYKSLNNRSFNYINVFDKGVGMVRGRHEDGRWAASFNADRREKYVTESTPRQYTFFVPQDVPGLAQLMGGRQILENELDSLFLNDHYWHGNEPDHQVPFMYNYTAAPWKTQKIVREILNGEYNDGPGGLSGNDDAGQISAWYVFGAIGFYPVDPVSGNYIMCSPLFDSIQIKLPGNKSFKIVCHKKNGNDQYISSVKLNGKEYSKDYIDHTDLVKGGRFDIWLQSAPSSWGSEVSDQPKGLSKQ
ncbi:MAG TPA: GH92 family glycosyl hydrolase [Chitinophagaceae bacterium]|nr:GH92 family glycosyl hydrolase [Chitinophagaceae bacterium]